MKSLIFKNGHSGIMDPLVKNKIDEKVAMHLSHLKESSHIDFQFKITGLSYYFEGKA